jgi:hypothetical protein
MRITTLLLLCILLVAALSSSAAADIVTVQPGEVLRLTFTAPFPTNCVNPISFPGIPPAPCDALVIMQDSANRVSPVGVLVTGSLFDGPDLLGTQTTTGCDERGPNGACNGFLFKFPVDPSGIPNGILDLTFSAPVQVDLSAPPFFLTGIVSLSPQGSSGLAGVFIRILSATVIVPSFPLPVEVDIKPNSFPNSMNPKSKGVFPVAILSTSIFDATTIDPLSVQFGPDGTIEAHGKGHIEDVDGDGNDDLVLHFRTQETGIACGDTSASLTGETFDGQQIQGSDSIQTVGCK